LNYTNIVSPVDGTVVSRNVDVGQTVAASYQTPTLFLVATDLTKMQVDTNVSESDIGAVKEGQPAIFRVDAYPDRDSRAWWDRCARRRSRSRMSSLRIQASQDDDFTVRSLNEIVQASESASRVMTLLLAAVGRRFRCWSAVSGS
jgi:multidrug resistance efflux pump